MQRNFRHVGAQLLFTGTLAALVAACSSVDGPTAPTFAVVPGPGQGIIEICKQGESAAVTGTFTFNISGVATPVTITANGTNLVCAFGVAVTAGNVTVTEQARAGFAVSSVTAIPAANLVSSDPAAGSAVAAVPLGGITTLIFTNKVQPPGTLKVCKEGATADVTGTFTFAVTGVPGTTSVAVPVGQCVFVNGDIAAGTVVTLTENAVAGIDLTDITIVPTGAGTTNLATRTATVTIISGATIEVTFTNAEHPPELPPGTLKVCKEGATADVTGSFTFAVAGVAGTTSVTVPVGQCVFVNGPIAAGTVVTLTETVPSDFILTDITIVPANAGTTNLAGHSATVTIASGATIEVTFTNAEKPPEVPPAGCTPGYFKNHQVPGLDATFASLGVTASLLTAVGQPTTLTLDQALDLQGGKGVTGAAETLLRAAAAAILNSQLSAGYPFTTAQIIAALNTALASGDRATMLALASQLDAANNLGCTLTFPNRNQ